MDRNTPIGEKSDGSRYRVLIIDDSVFLLKQLTQILQSENFEVIDSATDGEEGLEKFKLHYPKVDLVTMDITMPKMDGISTLEKIIQIDKNAKVIIVSALGKEDLVKKALLAGAKNYIIKPLDRIKVLERVESCIKGV